MQGTSGADIIEVLWKFFINAGGFPQTIQCDFDLRFIGGKAAALLRSHRLPPQKQNSQHHRVSTVVVTALKYLLYSIILFKSITISDYISAAESIGANC